ncbi:MAG: BamA/TamA family outer membrane protein [Gemmatimonadota bacterium]|nr:BamA/TamA family outer membrane protein [Gemmatimonadota bacterium]
MNTFLPQPRQRVSYWSIGIAVLLPLVYSQNIEAQTGPEIGAVIVEGTQQISTDRILSLMLTKSGGIFKKNRLNPATLRGDRDAIQNFYINSGFWQVRVRPFQEIREDGIVEIRIVIDEGPRYSVKEVNIVGSNYIDEEQIRRSLLTRVGQPFFRLFVATDRRTIQNLANNRSLLDARVDAENIFDETQNTVTVNFFITEGEPVRVGEVEIRGLRKTLPFAVRRELAIRPGDMYDSAKLIRSQTQLFQTGLFRSVRLEPVRSESDSTTRNLLVSVIELPSWEVSFGGGYASVEHLRGSIEVTQRNWLGRGITLGTNGQASRLLWQVAAGITQPWLFQTRNSGTIRGFFERQVRVGSHESREIGMSLTLGRGLLRTFRSQTTYTIKKITIDDISASLSQILQSGTVADSLRSRREGSLTQVVIYDTRDDILNPTKGFYSLIQASIASRYLGNSTANQNSLFSIKGTLRKYIPIPSFPDFATSVSLGYVRALNNGLVPVDRRLFLGGDKSVRGFDIDEIGTPNGGIMAFSSQNEIRVRLRYIDLAGFIDMGNIGDSVASFGLSDIRFGFGGGMRAMSPIGLIRTDIGFHRNKADEDKSLYARTFFYFGLGQAF